MSASPIRLRIDGIWQDCQPTDDLGFLGARYLCTLGSAAGQSEKKLLLRLVRWSQGKNAQVVPLQSGDIHSTDKRELRPAAMKTYDLAVSQPNGQEKVSACQVLQQDVTSFVPIRLAAQQALR